MLSNLPWHLHQAQIPPQNTLQTLGKKHLGLVLKAPETFLHRLVFLLSSYIIQGPKKDINSEEQKC